jgi:hypothetical protein
MIFTCGLRIARRAPSAGFSDDGGAGRAELAVIGPTQSRLAVEKYGHKGATLRQPGGRTATLSGIRFRWRNSGWG